MGSLIQSKKRIMMMQKNSLLPPDGYRWIEYAQSSPYSYVQVPYGFDETDIVELKGCILDSFADQYADKYMVAPSQWNTNNNRFAMLGGLNSKYTFLLGSQFSPNDKLQPPVPEDTNAHVCKYMNKQFFMTDIGSVADMTSATFGGTTTQLNLFFGYSGPTTGKIYYFKQTKSNGTKLNILPMQNISTGIVEMYDTESKTIMTRTGTLLAPQE